MPLFSILSSQMVNCTRIENKANMGEFFYFKLCLLEYKKKSSRIKYGYYHVMDLKSKCKLYGAKLLIAVL